jgi:histidinol-phosphatase (PHP family)
MNNNGIYTDYHMHSTFSVDGQDTMEALCRRALELGFKAVAITEHAEWHSRWHAGAWDVAGYFAEVERCKREFAPCGLEVYSGVELGNPHEFTWEAVEFVAAYPFEVRIASVHWLHGQNIHDSACFAGRDPLDVYADYFSSLGHMAADFSDIDIVAHFDRIFWRGTMIGAPFHPSALEGVIRDALAMIAWRDLALELNTRFLNLNPGWHEAIITTLKWFREEGGRRIVVNSDAHSISQMGRNLDQARRILDECGLEPASLQPALTLA